MARRTGLNVSGYSSDKSNEAVLDRVATLLSRRPLALSRKRLCVEARLSSCECDLAIRSLNELGMGIEETEGDLRCHLQDPLQQDWLEELVEAKVVLRRVCSSTNQMATEWRGQLPVLCLSEVQTQGRGRQGRKWIQAYGLGLMMSLGFLPSQHDTGPMALAISVSLAESLRSLGCQEVNVKWPNDLQARGCKLGGLLVLVNAGDEGRLIVGFGMNVYCSPNLDEVRTVNVSELTSSRINRNVLAVHCARCIVRSVQEYRCYGFEPFFERWDGYDALRGQRIRVRNSEGTFEGTAIGIDKTGALLLETGLGTRRMQYGEASLHQ